MRPKRTDKRLRNIPRPPTRREKRNIRKLLLEQKRNLRKSQIPGGKTREEEDDDHHRRVDDKEN